MTDTHNCSAVLQCFTLGVWVRRRVWKDFVPLDLGACEVTKQEFPYPSKGEATNYERSAIDRLLTAFATHKTQKKRSRRLEVFDPLLQLAHPKMRRPLVDRDIPLIFLCHDDRKFLPSFLSHYRVLGVTRFICVDDVSTDGTRDYLSLQNDVDLWVSGRRYGEARRGKAWREELAVIYGKNRWYLNVDSDEYLVYDDCFDRPLPELISRLEQLRVRRLSAPMLDMYPGGPVKHSEFDGSDSTLPWDVATHFDAAGYRLTVNSRFLRLVGGARGRFFSTNADLMKYPLLYWDEATSLGDNIHQPLPFDRNFFPISAALLHFKFFSDYREKSESAVADGQYFDGAREYRKILDAVARQGDLNFLFEGSLKYENPKQLVRLGFMKSIWR